MFSSSPVAPGDAPDNAHRFRLKMRVRAKEPTFLTRTRFAVIGELRVWLFVLVALPCNRLLS